VLAPVFSFVNVPSFDKFFSIKAALEEGIGGETVVGIGPKRELVRIFLSERFLRNIRIIHKNIYTRILKVMMPELSLLESSDNNYQIRTNVHLSTIHNGRWIG
jgi:hypothetical protein